MMKWVPVSFWRGEKTSQCIFSAYIPPPQVLNNVNIFTSDFNSTDGFWSFKDMTLKITMFCDSTDTPPAEIISNAEIKWW